MNALPQPDTIARRFVDIVVVALVADILVVGLDFILNHTPDFTNQLSLADARHVARLPVWGVALTVCGAAIPLIWTRRAWKIGVAGMGVLVPIGGFLMVTFVEQFAKSSVGLIGIGQWLLTVAVAFAGAATVWFEHQER